MLHIVQASADYAERLFIPHDHPQRRGGGWFRHHNGVEPFEPKGIAEGVSIRAEVYHGQWIVRCDSCPNAQLTARHDPRFFCIDCLNGAHGGKWVKVTWPRNSEKGELVLLARPLFHQRNWAAGQTVADLIAENIEHRDPVPPEVNA